MRIPSNKRNTERRKRVSYSKNYALVNKKTNSSASSNTFELSVAAAAVLNGDYSGIMAGLPLDKAKRLLESNELVELEPRQVAQGSVREITRHQANIILPALGALFNEQLPSHRPPRVNEF